MPLSQLSLNFLLSISNQEQSEVFGQVLGQALGQALSILK